MKKIKKVGNKMLKACSMSKSIDMQAIKFLKENDISIDVWNGEKYPNKWQLKQLLNTYDILIVGVEERITKDMIIDVKTPKIIASMSIGLDHIDEACFESQFVDIINCPNANVTSVAEHIFTLILDLSKRIQESNDLVISGKPNRKLLINKPSDISGKIIGLIGAGKISQKLVDIANVFSMPILCYTAHPNNHEDLIKKGIRFVELDELLQYSDIINVSVPLTNMTNNLISRDKIELLKKNAIFINTSRKGVADVDALIEFADKNPNFYLGLDIDIDEYADLLSKRRNNVIVTPHIAGWTDSAIKRQYMECAENIVKAVKKRKEINIKKYGRHK